MKESFLNGSKHLIKDWKKIRAMLRPDMSDIEHLTLVSNFWSYAPLSVRVLNWDTPVNWPDPWKLIADMESIACKTVVIFTPNGFIEQEGYDNNVLQIHKSGWTAADFRQKGYSVVGVNGLKALRTHEARLRFKPGFIWHRISYLTQMFVRNRPENAYQIFCVKKLA